MKFDSLNASLAFLEKEGELVRIKEPVDPNLEMAEITRRVFDAQGPALLFENVKGAAFPAASNIFGTYERTVKIFEPQLEQVRALVDGVSRPDRLLKRPSRALKMVPALAHALPMATRNPKVCMGTTTIDQLPLIKCWPKDGGGFVLLPQVFSQEPGTRSIFKSNLGMYRIQLSGNEYALNEEVGLHYQIHRGIGLHHQKALKANQPLKVSIFIGGPPAHTLAAVMPLPEGMPEVAFAGALAGRNFRYQRRDGYYFSGDADFCITGILVPGKTKPEGPFGDHLGYYSLTHEYPYLKVTGVYHRPNAVFPFTVVGRPPQEDSNFGRLIHDITRNAITKTLPGVEAVNAVDDAGVHPLLLAKARERYLPYEERQPRELLTHAHAILGTGQLSLAKYLIIAAHEDNPDLDVNDEQAFFTHVLERINLERDLHFTTQTTMDTLDYSGTELNAGSKLVMAAAGSPLRQLRAEFPGNFSLPEGFSKAGFAAPGMMVVQGPEFRSRTAGQKALNQLKAHWKTGMDFQHIPLVVVVDDADFAKARFANFLWVTFLRSNPSHDICGVGEKTQFKHWGCKSPMIIDARIKPFHASPLEPDPQVAERVDGLGRRGGPLAGII
ncbi:MAG: UbiD family decarboxylase [Desulfobacterales bacterium]|nr:UbiD family decarboxylase [Desulfobacterales bacterium]